MKAAVGMKVEACKEWCDYSVGILADRMTWSGEVIKANKKTIRVHITGYTHKRGLSLTNIAWPKPAEYLEDNGEEVYTLVRTLDDGAEVYRSKWNNHGEIKL